MCKKLRICHYAQMPCEPYIVEVENIKEAKKLSDILADYDLFQYTNMIKPDYSSMTILEEYDNENKEWHDWFDEDTGIDNLDEFVDYLNKHE